MIDVRKLAMLAALDRLGTIAAVAEEVHLAAPGISMQLNTLERELGVPLTERRGRRLALTPAGKLLAAHGRDITDRISLAELEVDALRRGAVGAYRIAAFPSSARTFVADAWHGLLERGEGLQISLTTPEPDEALAALAAGETDIAIVHAYSNVPRDLPQNLTTTGLATEPVRLAIKADDLLAPPSAAGVDLADFAHHRWITPERPHSCFQMTERACGLAGFRPAIAAQSMDFAAQLALVAAGVGVALVPHLTVGEPPPGILLVDIQQPVQRHLFACNRAASDADAGVLRLRELLSRAATAWLRPMAPSNGPLANPIPTATETPRRSR